MTEQAKANSLALTSPEPEQWGNETEQPQLDSETPPIEARAYEPDDFDFNIDEETAAGNNIIDDEEMGLANDRFTSSKPVWNDVPYAIFFLVVFLTFTVTSMKNMIKHYSEYREQVPWFPGTPIELHLNFGLVVLLIIVTCISTFISVAIFFLADRYTYKITSLGFTILSYGSAIVGGFLLFSGSPLSLGLLLFGVLSLVILYKFSPSVELAANILSEAIKILKNYPSTAALSFLSLVLILFLEVIFTIAIGTTFVDFGFKGDGTHKFNENGEDISIVSTSLILTILFLSFSKYYISDVLRNVIYTTIAGVYGSWYYMQNTFAGMPTNEGVGALKRACTYSFGSICCGSIYVVIFQIFANLFSILHIEQTGFLGDLLVSLFMVLAVLLGYFNMYVYSYVGVYGAGIWKSFKATYSFVRQRGWFILRKDLITLSSLNFICGIAAIVGAIVTGIYLFVFGSLFHVTGTAIPAIIAFAYLMTVQITATVTGSLSSGSASFFLSLNKDPAVFQETSPFEFQEISRCYPPILDKLNLNN